MQKLQRNYTGANETFKNNRRTQKLHEMSSSLLLLPDLWKNQFYFIYSSLLLHLFYFFSSSIFHSILTSVVFYLHFYRFPNLWNLGQFFVNFYLLWVGLKLRPRAENNPASLKHWPAVQFSLVWKMNDFSLIFSSSGKRFKNS